MGSAFDARARSRTVCTRVERSYPASFEVRGKPGSIVTLQGYASVYEQSYEMWDMFGPYVEVVRRGAGARTLSANPATQLLLNHAGLSMAYTRAGTLRLSEDERGLLVSADVNTTRGDVRDLVTAIEDGNVNEMSFAFRITDQTWSPDYDHREILEYNLDRGDVSVVNFGANPATNVMVGVNQLNDETARALLIGLGHQFGVSPRKPLSVYVALASAQG